MEILYILIPLSVALVVLASTVFLVMSENGQFEDLDRAAHDILMDDDHPINNPAHPIESFDPDQITDRLVPLPSATGGVPRD